MNQSKLRVLPMIHCGLAAAALLFTASVAEAQITITSRDTVFVNGTATPSTNVPLGTYAWTRSGPLTGQYDQVPAGGGQPSVESFATTPIITPAYAATAMADASVAPEFNIVPWATPPLVNHPTAIAAAPDGTVYVGMDGAGSLGASGHLGRVVRLRDLNHDGVVDEAKPFVPDLDSVRGVVWYHDHLIVLATDVSAFYDRDGDGIAEEKRTLITGLNWPLTMATVDHGKQNIEAGIDGWIYHAVGDIGIFKAVGSDGRTLQLRGGAVLRFRPDGSGMELFATGLRNIYGLAVSPLLDILARDNTNDGGGWNVRVHHFTGMTEHGYPSLWLNFPDEIITPLADFGGGSGVGAMWLDEPGIPAKWNDAPYTADWGQRALFHHALVPKGATFSLPGFEVTTNSINGVPLAAGPAGIRAGNEPFFQTANPLDADVDGNGNIYIASWRGGGYTWGTINHGMVYRVSMKESTPAPLPDFNRISAAELIQVLNGPSHVRRMEAQRTILARKAELGAQIAPMLEALSADTTKPIKNRVAALFTDKQLRGSASTASIARLAADPTIAAWAIRALGDDLAQARSIPINVVTGALRSSDPRTRKEALITLARADSLASASAMTPLLGDSDPIVSHTAMQALRSLRAVDASLAVVDSASASPTVRKGAIMVLEAIHEARVTDALAQRLGREADANRRTDLVNALLRLANTESQWNGTWWAVRPSNVGPYYAPAPWSETPKVLAALSSALDKAGPEETLAIARKYIKQGVPAGPAANKFLAYADTEPALVPQITTYFAGVDEIPANAIPVLTKVAATTTYAANVRVDAITALAKTSDRGNWTSILSSVATLGQGGGAAGRGGGAGRGAGAAPAAAAFTPVQTSLITAMDAAVAIQSQAVAAARSALATEPFMDPSTPAAVAQKLEALSRAEQALASARADYFARIQASVARMSPAQVTTLVTQSATAAPVAAAGGRGAGGGRGGAGGAQAATPVDQARLAVLNSPRLDDVYPVLIDEAAKLNGESSQLADAALLTISARKFGATAPREAATRALDAGWSDASRRLQIINAAVAARDTSRAQQIAAAANDADIAIARTAQNAMQQLSIDPVQLAAAAAAPKISTMQIAAVLDAVVPARGTVARGAQLVRELGCVACHTVSASEAPKGPPLYLVSGILPRRELAEAILVPNKTISQGFVTTQITRRSGETVTGFVVQEATDAVSLRDMTSQVTRIPLTDVASRARLDTSMMPVGLTDNLTVTEFASLLDYIASLANPAP